MVNVGHNTSVTNSECSQRFPPHEWNVGPVTDAVWIGTSGINGEGKSFNVLQENLPFTLTPSKKVRFYIQGLTDQGDVLPWNRCAYVDVSL